MNIEIIEFYPLERNELADTLSGTLRIRIVDLGIHVLGIFVSKRKDQYFFRMPGKKAYNYKTSEEVWYPFIIFEDKEKQSALMEAIKANGRAYIDARLVDESNPLIFPKKKEKEVNDAKPVKVKESAPETRETAKIETPKPTIPIAMKQWQDLPPRKSSFVRGKR